MELPIDSDKLRFVLAGEPEPLVRFDTLAVVRNAQGHACGFRMIPYTHSDRIRTPIPEFSYTPGQEELRSWRDVRRARHLDSNSPARRSRRCRCPGPISACARSVMYSA
jgi:hypothetical protein